VVISLMSKANHARVHCRFEDGVCELVLDNPGRKNALSLSLLADLNSKLNKAGDEKARAVVLTGAGNTFSSGADLADLTGTADDLAIDKAIEQAVDCIRSLPGPVIAAVEGACMGGAVDIALACDALVVSEEAFFQVPATRLGLLYNPRAIRRWHNRLGAVALRSMLLLGERFTAETAVRVGLASHLVPAGGARDKSWDLARAAAMGTQDAVAATKGLLTALESGDTDLKRWEKVYNEILNSTERRESVGSAKKKANRKASES